MEDDAELRLFHNTVRENIIFFLLFIVLNILSYAIIGRFKRRDREDYFSTDEDEATVYKISLWLCTFALAISLGVTLLLPISIVSNEVLILYPNSYYVQWLNSSLIQGLWNHVFLFSNISLLILLPFAYLFTESEGFSGYRKGLSARVCETFTVLFLMAVFVFGMAYVISALIDEDKESKIQTFFNLWTYYLPFLYSCMSFLGVLLLLLCTPLGFVRLFGIVGQFLVKPQFLRNVDEEFDMTRLEEDCARRRLHVTSLTGRSYMSPSPMAPAPPLLIESDKEIEENGCHKRIMSLQNGALQSGLGKALDEMKEKRENLEKQKNTSSLRRNLFYPIIMLALLFLMTMTIFMVVQNTLGLLIGMKALPLSTRQFTLGVSSLSKLGPFGAILEIFLIFYLIVTSSVGLYTIPFLSRVCPKTRNTPFSHIVANCYLLLFLSSALPLLSRIIGITNFDLLGDYGQIEWLGNFKLVLFYNVVFAASATLCLVNKFTATVRRELWARFIYHGLLIRKSINAIGRKIIHFPFEVYPVRDVAKADCIFSENIG